MNTTITTQQPPRQTPWGRWDGQTKLAEGIWSVYTSGHGGWYVAPELFAQMPEFLRQTAYSGGGWFEEDCDWSIPCLFFWKDLPAAVATPERRQAAIATISSVYHARLFVAMKTLGLIPEAQ